MFAATLFIIFPFEGNQDALHWVYPDSGISFSVKKKWAVLNSKQAFSMVRRQLEWWEKSLPSIYNPSGRASYQQVDKWTEQRFFRRKLTKDITSWKELSLSLTIREAQRKTILRCHTTPVSVAAIKQTSDNKCHQGGGERGPLTLLPACKPAKAPWKSRWSSLQKLKGKLPGDSFIPLRMVPDGV